MLKKVLILALCFGISEFFAQRPSEEDLINVISSSENDSIKGDAFYKLSQLVKFRDIQLARSYSDSGAALFQKIGDDIRFREHDYLEGVLRYSEGDLDGSEEIGVKYYDWTVESNNDIRRSYALTLLAKVKREKGEYGEAINYAVEGMEVSNTRGYAQDVGYYATELGNIYSTLRQWDLSKTYFEKAYEVAQSTNYPIAEAVSLRNLGENAIESGDFEKAKEYFNKSIDIDSQLDYRIGLSRSHRNLGHLYEKQGEIEKSLEYYEKALTYIQGTNNNVDLASIHLGLAKTQLLKSNLRETKINIDKCYEYGALTNSLQFSSDLFLLESQYYEKRGNTSMALSKAREYEKSYQELLNEKVSNEVTGMNVRYETEQKEKEIELLNSKNDIAELELKASNRLNLAFGLGLGLVGLFSFFLFGLYQKIQLQNRIISKALSEKDILLREIHHRVKNNLQFVSSLLNLQSRHVEDEKALSALKEGQNRVKSMAIIHQNLYQEERLTAIDMKDYFEKLTSSLFSSYNIAPDKIRLEMDIENVNLDVNSVIPIGLIVNELISNSLKHAFPSDREGVIKVILTEKNEEMILEVADNGVGMDPSVHGKFKESFGYRLINAFQSQLNADLDIQSEVGTIVKMRIKDYQKVA